MPLFEVAIIQTKSDDQKFKREGKETLVVPITAVLAKNEDSAKLKAVSLMDDEFNEDWMEVLVRPFS